MTEEEEFQTAYGERHRETREEDLRVSLRSQRKRRRIRCRALVMLFVGIVAIAVFLARQTPFLLLAVWLAAVGAVAGAGIANEVHLYRLGQRVAKLKAELASLDRT